MIEKNKIHIKVYMVIFISLLSLGIIGFMFLEDFSLLDSIYFSIVTMATVGYGDIHPQTEIGKFLALIIIIGGVGTFLGVVASITDFFVNKREELKRLQKLNIVTGLFFSEMGSELLKYFYKLDPKANNLHTILKINNNWKDKDFNKAHKLLKSKSLEIDLLRGDILIIKNIFQSKGDFLLRMLENPNIQEHEEFTDLLEALFHVRDEISHRSDLSSLTDPDRKHLEFDILRVYDLLIYEWLRYMQYLKNNYSYLFSLAKRTNPFDPDSNITIL